MAPSSKSTCRSRCVLAGALSFKTQHVCAKPGRRCVEACRAKRRHAVTHRGQGLGTDMLTHPARRISYSETAAHARSCCRKKFQCPSFKYDSTFLTCLSRTHSPPSGTGFSAYKAFPAPAATCPRLAASPSRGFYRPAARGRMQTFTAPRAPPAGEIVRLVHICTRDLYAFVRETLTLSSLR